MPVSKDGGCFLVPLEEQMIAFWVSIGAGCLAAFCFDVYRALVRQLSLKRVGLGIGDIIFWTTLAGLVFTLLFLSNGGEMRGFMLFGLALGACVYVRVFGLHSLRVINGFFGLIRKLMMFISKLLVGIWIIITTPIKFVCLVIAWPFKFVNLLLRKIVYYISRFFPRLIPAGIKKVARKLVLPFSSWKAFWKRKKK